MSSSSEGTYATSASSLSLLALPAIFYQRREVIADVLVYRTTSPPSGAIKPTAITIESGHGQYLGISFFESQIGNAGEQWRSSAWTAIASSSLMLGEDLNEYRFSFDAEGGIDGPSAGSLFTSSTLALILGDSLKSDVTMTGTINPDGSIGPVGGIPQKVQAAHEQGKTRVGIPAGKLTPELRDLEAELGIDVQEVTNIGEAYELLTGRQLPLPAGFADVPPEMSTAGTSALQDLIETLHKRYQSERQENLTNPIPDDFDEVDQAARDSFSASRQSVRRGDLPQAYNQAREALLQLGLLQNLIQTQSALEEFAEKPWDRSVLTQAWEPIMEEAEALVQTLSTTEVTTAHEAIAVSRAFGHVIMAMGLQSLAAIEVEQLKTAEVAQQPDSEAYRRATFYLAIAPAVGADQLQTAKDAISLQDITPGRPLVQRELNGFTNTLNTAAVAGIRAFESLTIRPLADSGAAAFELVAEDFKSKDINYFLALATLDSLNDVIDAMEDKQNARLAKLGGSQLAYLLSSILVSQYYSLDASFDPELEEFGVRSAVEFENPRALIDRLDMAEVSARGNIAMAQAAGNDVIQQILLYEQAKFLREGTAADKLDALGRFWNASLEARLMTIFAGEFELSRSPSPFRGAWLGLGLVVLGLAITGFVGWHLGNRHWKR